MDPWGRDGVASQATADQAVRVPTILLRSSRQQLEVVQSFVPENQPDGKTAQNNSELKKEEDRQF